MNAYQQRQEILQAKEVDYPMDFLGNKLEVGDTVVRACVLGRSPVLELRTVVKVEDKKVFTKDGENGRTNKVHFNSRLLVINKHK